MAIRVLPTNTLVYEQIDYFQGDFFTRITGLDNTDITLTGFYNNQPLSWTLVSGVGVMDSQVVAGNVYFNEIQSGYYGIRFKPNVAGYWRLLVDYPPGVQSIALDYDILEPVSLATGLKASFIKPC